MARPTKPAALTAGQRRVGSRSRETACAQCLHTRITCPRGIQQPIKVDSLPTPAHHRDANSLCSTLWLAGPLNSDAKARRCHGRWQHLQNDLPPACEASAVLRVTGFGGSGNSLRVVRPGWSENPGASGRVTRAPCNTTRLPLAQRKTPTRSRSVHPRECDLGSVMYPAFRHDQLATNHAPT